MRVDSDLVKRLRDAEERLPSIYGNQEMRRLIEEVCQALSFPRQQGEPAAWRYQRKVGWGDVWRVTEFNPANDAKFFEAPDAWTVQPLYSLTPAREPVTSANDIAKPMWESDHDGRWEEWGDGQDESRNIYLANAEVVLAQFDVRVPPQNGEGA